MSADFEVCAQPVHADPLMFSQRPRISIPAYLSRLVQYLRPPSVLILVTLYFLDRMSAIDETFVFDSRTAHRFLLVAMVVACKGLLDQTLSMREFAKIGGVGVWELSYLEREFLFRNNWRIFVEPELLEDYYQALLGRTKH